jgi:outer membrane protein TolC
MARSAEAASRNRALELRRDARRTFHELAHEHALFELSRAERQLADQTLRVSAAAYTSGRVGRLAVVRAQSEIARIESELAGYPARIAVLEARLIRLMGAEAPQASAGGPVLPVPTIAEPGPMPVAPHGVDLHPMVQMRSKVWNWRASSSFRCFVPGCA